MGCGAPREPSLWATSVTINKCIIYSVHLAILLSDSYFHDEDRFLESSNEAILYHPFVCVNLCHIGKLDRERTAESEFQLVISQNFYEYEWCHAQEKHKVCSKPELHLNSAFSIPLQQSELFTCEPGVQQKEMEPSLAAAKSLSTLALNSFPSPVEQPAAEHRPQCMPDTFALASPDVEIGFVAEAEQSQGEDLRTHTTLQAFI